LGVRDPPGKRKVVGFPSEGRKRGKREKKNDRIHILGGGIRRARWWGELVGGWKIQKGKKRCEELGRRAGLVGWVAGEHLERNRKTRR